MKENYFIILLILYFSILHAQERPVKVIHGKVIVESASVEGIHVLNLMSEQAMVTNFLGEFFIEAKEDDLIVFSAVHLNYWRKSIKENDFKTGFLEVIMTPKEMKLNEVVLT